MSTAITVLTGHAPSATPGSRAAGQARPVPPALPVGWAAVLLAALFVVLPAGRTAAAAAAVLDLSVALAIGLTVFARVAVPLGSGAGREQAQLGSLVRGAALAGTVAALVSLLASVVVLSGGDVGELVRGSGWSSVLGSGQASASALRVLGLGLVALAAGRLWDTPTASALAGVGLAVAVVPYAVIGHGASQSPQPLVAALIVTHVLGVALWVGGVVGLGLVLRSRRALDDWDGGVEVAHRFSQLMIGGLVTVLGAGTVLALLFLPSPLDVFRTGYGLTLLAKLMLVGVVVALGGLNHTRVLPRLREGARGAWSVLLRNCAVEGGLLVAVVVVSSVLATLNLKG